MVDNTLDSASIYDPTSNSWSATASLKEARSGHTATLLSGGKVLIAGGGGDTDFPTSTELYDPTGDTWSDAGDLATARCFHTATLLRDGSVLVVGGINSDGVLASSEIFSMVATRSTNKAGPRRNRDGPRYDELGRFLPQ